MRAKWITPTLQWRYDREALLKRKRRKRGIPGISRTIKVSGVVDPAFERKMKRKGVRVVRATD